MSPFAAPMYLAPSATTARRYDGQDYARRERGYAARYARRTTAPLTATVIAWRGVTLAQVGDAWVRQDAALAA